MYQSRWCLVVFSKDSMREGSVPLGKIHKLPMAAVMLKARQWSQCNISLTAVSSKVNHICLIDKDGLVTASEVAVC